MSTVVFRVDPRLVHATLTSAWLPALGFEWIMIADASVRSSSRLRHIYEMSAMDSADLYFTSEQEVAHQLERAAGSRPGVVLFSSLDAAWTAAEGGASIDLLRISHVPEGEGRYEVLPGVHLGPGERTVIHRLRQRGIRVVIQPLPDDPMVEPVVPVFASAGSERGAEPGADREAKLEAELEIVNERGLHLRAAHVLSDAVSASLDEVHIGIGTELVNAKSLLGLTTLGAGCGTRLRVVVAGPSAAATLDRVRALFASGFREGSATPEDAS